MHLIGKTVGESLALAKDEPEREHQSDTFKLFVLFICVLS